MKNRKELEFRIFACIMLKPQMLEENIFEGKYFKYSNILSCLKKVYAKYKNLDINLLMSDDNGIKIDQFVDDYIETLSDSELIPEKVFPYYQQLKEIWRKEEIINTTVGFQQNKFNFEEFTQKMFELTSEDYDNNSYFMPNEINDELNITRELTEIDELDYLLKGLEYGKLNLFSGITNHGKTTFMIQIAKNFIKQHKKIFYFSGEQTAEEFKRYLYVGMCTKDQLNFIKDEKNSRIYDVMPKKEVIDYFNNIYANDFVVYNNNLPQNDVDMMIKVMKKAFRSGIRIFFIDNFMQLDNSEKLEEQTKIVEQFKRFAIKNNCIVCLVAHPRKTQFMKNKLSIFDIAGTQNIANKSSNICTITRTDMLNESDYEEFKKELAKNGYDIEKCDAIVEVLKTKGNANKVVGLKYLSETKTYIEASKSSEEELKGKITVISGKRKREE